MNIDTLLLSIPDKHLRWKSTTSRVFKKDLYNFLIDKDIQDILEIGTNQGLTSLILSYVSKNVYTVELTEHNVNEAKKHCSGRNNITFINGDAYSNKTYTTCPKYFDVVVIDCLHDYESVIKDINRALSYTNPEKGIYLVFDDYSHPEFEGVRSAINECIEMGLKVQSYLGHPQDHTVVTSEAHSFKLVGPEGVILSYGI
jgi:predicted O-methyltransferase YrrM